MQRYQPPGCVFESGSYLCLGDMFPQAITHRPHTTGLTNDEIQQLLMKAIDAILFIFNGFIWFYFRYHLTETVWKQNFGSGNSRDLLSEI